MATVDHTDPSVAGPSAEIVTSAADASTEVEQTTPGAVEDTNAQSDDKPQPNIEDLTFHDLRDEDAAAHGVVHSDEETHVGAPDEDRDLPDLYRYLRGLEQGDTDLESVREPPSLFNRPEHLDKYKNISSLKYEVNQSEVEEYVQKFDAHVKDDVLMIANISLEEIQAEERRLRDEYIEYQKQQKEQQKQQKLELRHRADSTRKRIAKEMKDKRKRLLRMIDLAKKQERLQFDLLHVAFLRAQSQLSMALKRRKTEVMKMFGSLEKADGENGGSKGKRWKLDWDKAPQPIQIKLKTLRGVRDKLPASNYVLVVSLYNRLGGHLLQWSKVTEQLWGGTTMALPHDGNFYNSEIKINQSLFTVLPSKPSMRPGMIITFELFILKGPVLNTDRVVAWGCFPVCDGAFQVIEGKYKAPMVRGEMDLKLDKHSQIEKVISSDLDHWLCNLYFEIVKLPRFMSGQKEYEVELQFTSVLVNHPDRINLDGEEYKDSENPVFGSVAGSSVHVADSMSDVTSLAPTTNTNKMSSLDSLNDKNIDDEDSGSLDLSGKENSPRGDELTQRQQNQFRNKKTPLNDSTDSDASVNEKDMFVLKKEPDEFKPAPDDIGLYYKRHLNNPVDVYTKKLYSMQPRNGVRSRRQKKNLTYAEELELHTPSVKAPFSEKGRIAERGWKRVSYIARMFMAELGLSEWRSREFWVMLILFIFTFFMRIFIHYCGQFLFLKALNIPINSFNFLPYTVRLNYQSSLLNPVQEISIIILGPATVLVLFAFIVLLCWIVQLTAGMFPDLGSKFILMFGIQSFCDPLFIAVVDLAQNNYNYNTTPTSMPLADFSKLYWFFVRTQGSGVGGALVTVFIYLFTMFASAAILYMYFLRLHNNGRMLDIYWRLHGEMEDIFIPYDLEISIQELEHILHKAEQWRGEEGERRKVAVYDYVWEEEDTNFAVFDETLETVPAQTKSKKKEKTTHIAIHTLHTDGLRELHRHFLALPNGAIVEVFGEMSYIPGLTKEIKKAINQGAQKVEHLVDFGSAASLNKQIGEFRSRSSSYATAHSMATASKATGVHKLTSSSTLSDDTMRTPLTGRAIHVSVPNSEKLKGKRTGISTTKRRPSVSFSETKLN